MTVSCFVSKKLFQIIVNIFVSRQLFLLCCNSLGAYIVHVKVWLNYCMPELCVIKPSCFNLLKCNNIDFVDGETVALQYNLNHQYYE